MKQFITIMSLCCLCACTTEQSQQQIDNKATTTQASEVKDSIVVKEELPETKKSFEIDDSLNALANIISGIDDDNNMFDFVKKSEDFKDFSKSFSKRWKSYDTTRIARLKNFRENEISKIVSNQSTLFYPFSGPDILHAQTFFPKADKYVMIGLEPVGSLPVFKKEETDSLESYFQKINTSLNAILKFSFFRTQSMKEDLKNEEVNGTLHLLCLFLKRTGNQLASIKPVIVDSLGQIEFVSTFEKLQKLKTNTRGVEIKFNDINQTPNVLYYFSLNASDAGLKHNQNFSNYLKQMGEINTYLKGASYLMHKDYFSIIRQVILEQSKAIIQDDSGIAFHYFTESKVKWKYYFYGDYTKPIPMFAQHYQRDLDSLSHLQGSKPLGFGIGYNFRDKNSNFMIAVKQ
ncbi:MAG: hypothetical protein IT237_07190 [Bacteroidia bacterium]|nr:hypothetical protein [Bacteroidia bacterium]